MKASKIVVLGVLIVCAMPLFAAFDGYIRIDGVQGGAKDPAHQGWIELQSWDWTAANPNASAKCTSTHEVSFLAKGGPAGTGEAKLMEMCTAHMPMAQLTVEIAGQRHVLQNVAFRTCHTLNNEIVKGNNFTIYFSRCAMHAAPPK